MNIHDFEFALFVQDQAANSEVLQSRKALYLGFPLLVSVRE